MKIDLDLALSDLSIKNHPRNVPTREELLQRNSFPSVNDNKLLTKMLEAQSCRNYERDSITAAGYKTK
jgi:hypothetical protein